MNVHLKYAMSACRISLFFFIDQIIIRQWNDFKPLIWINANGEQQRDMRRLLVCRFVYNKALALQKEITKQEISLWLYINYWTVDFIIECYDWEKISNEKYAFSNYLYEGGRVNLIGGYIASINYEMNHPLYINIIYPIPISIFHQGLKIPTNY